MRDRHAFISIGSAVFCFVVMVALERFQSPFYAALSDSFGDALARNGRMTPANPDLVFLAIDSDSTTLDESSDIQEMYGLTNAGSVEAHALTLMTRSFPWSREVYALILQRLVEAGAKVVVFDLTFPTSSDTDLVFRAALDRYRDHVVLGSNFVSAAKHEFSDGHPSHTRPPETLIPQSVPMDDRVGYTNFWADPDDVVRYARYRVTFEQIAHKPIQADAERYVSLGGRALIKAGFADAIPSGLNSRRFRYTAPPRQGFRPRSLFEIFVPEYWKHNYKSGAFFRDKIVVVGAEGNWQHDEHPTPFGSMPGPEVHLNAINAALHRAFIHEVPLLGLIFLHALAAAAGVLFSMRIRSPWWRLAALALTNALTVAFAFAAYNLLSLYVPIVGPSALLDVTVLVGLMFDFARERLEKNRVRRTLERYVSHNVVRELLDKPQLYADALGGVMKPVSILFSDIRGYSTVSARTDPQALVAQLNEYLTAMVDCVFQHGGTLDKFIGDAVMAVWGNTRSDGVREDASNAVRAALDMKKALVRLNDDWRRRGLPELRIGLAVNHGPVVVGNIGSQQRMEFTVVGDAVNTSWKLQEMTKTLGWDLLVGERVAALIIENFELRPFGSFDVRDNAAMEVFGVVDEIASAPAARIEALPTSR